MIFERRNQRGEARPRGKKAGQENEARTIEIREFSWPYGRRAHERRTSEFICQRKQTKYAELAEEGSRIEKKEVRVTAVIIFPLGGVYEPSLKDLQ
jgi:hypothetical protein